MKKSLSLLLAISMVFSMFATVAFADDHADMTVQEKYEALKEAGIFEGMADGSAGLDEDMTRAQAARIVSLLFDLDLTNPPANPTFSDVPAEHWAYEEVEAAVAAGIINGRGDGEFDPGTVAEVAAGVGHVTSQELAVMLSLGFEMKSGIQIDSSATTDGNVAPWAEQYVAFAIEQGLIMDQSDYTNDAQRGELVVAAFSTKVEVEKAEAIEALEIEGVEVVDADTIIVTYNNEDVVEYDLDPALEYNEATEVTVVHEPTGKEFTTVVTLEVDEDAPTVESIESLNKVQVLVTFNEEVDISDIEATIGGNAAKATKTGDATVVLSETSQEYSSAAVEIKKVADAAGNVMPAYKETVTFFDYSVPTVDSAEQTAPRTFKVTFSEPVTKATAETTGNYEVDGGTYFVKDATLTSVNTVEVELYTNIPDGNHTVEVSNVEDFAGYAVNTTEVAFTAANDTVAPTFESVKSATPNKVVLVFSEDVELVAGIDGSDFYHTNSNNEADSVAVSGKELTLTFTTNPLPQGLAYITVPKNVVEDGWGNKNAAFNTTAEVTLDVTLPTLKEVKASDDQTIVVTFSEAVSLNQDIENFTLLNASGDEVSGITVDAGASSDTKTTLTSADPLPGGVYTLVVEDVKDAAGNIVDNATASFTVTDTTAPTVEAQGTLYAEQQIAKISFSEPMDPDDVLDLSNYYYVTGSSLDEYDASISIADNGKAVLIDLGDEDSITLNDGDDIVVARVTDAVGNGTEAFTTTVNLVTQTGIEIDTVKATSKSTVVVTLKDALTSFDADDFSVVYDTVNEEEVDLATVNFINNDSGKGVITYTLTGSIDTDATVTGETYGLKVITVADPVSENTFGVDVEANQEAAVADGIAPEFADVDVTGTTVTIDFTEDVQTNTLSIYTFSVSGKTVTDIDAGANDLTSSVTLTLNKAVTAGSDVTVATELAIKDAEGNSTDSLSEDVEAN